MHTDSPVDPHKVPHGCTEEGGAGRFGVSSNSDVAHDDVSGGIDVVAVQIGTVVFVLLRNFEFSGGCAVALASRGDL